EGRRQAAKPARQTLSEWLNVRKPCVGGFPHMLVGYMRVSTDGDRQVLDLQRDALLAAGVDERHLFEDHASGSGDDRAGKLTRSPLVKITSKRARSRSGALRAPSALPTTSGQRTFSASPFAVILKSLRPRRVCTKLIKRSNPIAARLAWMVGPSSSSMPI